jgi:hypothetical protein
LALFLDYSLKCLFTKLTSLFLVFDIGEQWFHELQISKFIELYLRCFEDTTTDLVIAALIYVERLLEAAIKEVGEEGAKVTQHNAKGILHAAMTLATKFQLDRYEKKTIFFGVSINCTRHKMRQMTDRFIGMLEF